MMLRCVVTLALVLQLVHAADECDNQVFMNKLMGFSHDLKLGSSPAPHPTAFRSQDDACVAWKGKDSCCTTATLESIEEFYEKAQAAINATGAALDKGNNYTTQFLSRVAGYTALFCSGPLSGVFKKRCEEVAALVSGYTRDVAETSFAIARAELGCASALNEYTKGMMCFACETNWTRYYSQIILLYIISLLL